MFETMIDSIISTFFGNVWIFGLAVLLFFIVVCISIGLDFSTSILLVLPFSVFIASNGLLSGYEWIKDVILVIVGLTYGFIIIKLFNR